MSSSSPGELLGKLETSPAWTYCSHGEGRFSLSPSSWLRGGPVMRFEGLVESDGTGSRLTGQFRWEWVLLLLLPFLAALLPVLVRVEGEMMHVPANDFPMGALLFFAVAFSGIRALRVPRKRDAMRCEFRRLGLEYPGS